MATAGASLDTIYYDETQKLHKLCDYIGSVMLLQANKTYRQYHKTFNVTEMLHSLYFPS